MREESNQHTQETFGANETKCSSYKRAMEAKSSRNKQSRRWFTVNSVTLLAVACFQLLTHKAALSARAAGAQLAVPSSGNGNGNQHNYFGTLIGRLTKREHNVSGEVFAVDEQTLFIKNFNYDGSAPDAYFWSSVSAPQPSALDGFIVPDEKGSTKPLERYSDKDVVLRLPEGRTLREINWLSVWSRQTKQNLGEIMIPRQSLSIPRPLEISALSQLAHGLKSGPITIVDAQTFLVPDFHYDGLGPAAYFWLTRGAHGLTANGLRLKDENGSGQALRKYSGETVVITLPEELTIYDFDYFGVWCKEFQVNFGQTRIPQSAKVPPSPKMLGIKPENKLNCEILYDDLGYEIRWVLDGDDIVMQLVGKIEPGEYMAFGLGKDDSRSDMQNADAVVTWVDRTSGQVHAIDYFLGAKQQCSQTLNLDTSANLDEAPNSNEQPQQQAATSGSCPDSKLPGGGDSLTLLHGAIVNGYSMVTFKRPQLGIDELYDQHVYSDGQQSVLWAIGVLNSKKEIGYHRLKTRANMFIDFARNPQWNCPIPDLNASMHTAHLPVSAASQLDPTVVSSAGGETSSPAESQRIGGQRAPVDAPPQQQVGVALNKSTLMSAPDKQQDQPEAWFIPAIVCPPDRTFYAQIGPTGGRKGYEALTGRTSWGVSWYVNGLMIPELVVERGQTYRFVVEGGSDKTSATRRHPFYLTDSAEGGFDFKTDDERVKERIFGGVALRGDGQFVPTAEGRLCEWKHTNSTLLNADLYNTFAAYQRSLRLDCLPGQASMLKFAPDANTPDLIYYQCYTHRFMGWRIRVVNSCSAFIESLANNNNSNNNNNNNNNNHNLNRGQQDGQTRRPLAEMIGANGAANNMHKAHPRRSSREKSSTDVGELLERSVYNRRSLAAPSTSSSLVDTLVGSPSESRMSLQDMANGQQQQQHYLQDFQQDGEGLPSDMLILNNSQLIQRQPFNLSNFDEVLKLSPADLEFIDSQPATDSSLDAYLAATLAPPMGALPLHNFSQSTTPKAQSENKTTASTKTAKTLHSYMRRLASIYYPVQQQLASMLASQSSATAAGNQHQAAQVASIGSQAAASQTQAAQTALPSDQSAHSQSGGFSLSSLVPKSKIDLSKSTISKKLNKLRFNKSGRKYELQQQARPSQPPTPANEFNYDIFNNQLAQLEKQQKQLQSLEMAAGSWPQQQQQQQQSDSFNYLPMMTVSSEEQQAIDSMNSPQAAQIFLGNVQHQPTGFNQLHLAKQPAASGYQQQRYLPRQPLRYSETPLGPPNSAGQQPYVIDYLSMMFNRSAEPPVAPAASTRYPPQQFDPGWPSSLARPSYQAQRPQQQPRPSNRLQQQQQQQQPSIYITRLPQPLVYPLFAGANKQDTSRLWAGSARYPQKQHLLQAGDSQPIGAFPATTAPTSGDYSPHQMSTMPSVALTIHDTLESAGYSPPSHHFPSQQVGETAEVESLSGSGSGSHYDFRQQPAKQIMSSEQQQLELAQANAKTPGELDHMLAIERFSKQSSERRLPSIVHPVTGEHVHLSTLANLAEQQQQQQQQHEYQAANQTALPRRFSALLAENHLAGSSSEPPPSVQTNELLEADQTTTRAGDLRRVNMSESAPTRIVLIEGDSDKMHQRLGSSLANLSQQQNPQQQQQSTTESVTPVLVKPNSFDYYREQAASSTPASSSGPLVPSLGPPAASAYSAGEQENDLLVFKSNLIEPVREPGMSRGEPLHQVSRLNFDTGPFTPIELTNPLYYATNPQQFAAPHLVTTVGARPRPLRPPLIDAMLSQHQSPFRPEPPVQVASYLAQHLASHNPMYIASEKSVASSQPMALSVSLPAGAPSSQQQQQQQHFARSGNHNYTNDLIILKPAALAKQNTYLLKPEYLTNQFKLLGSSDGAPTNPQADLYYSNEINPGEQQTSARRLAGHQFDRLSSLSSPPSTSIALDPLQVAANTLASYNTRQVNESSSAIKPPVDSEQAGNTTTIVVEADKLSQHRQIGYLPSKPIPLSLETSSSNSNSNSLLATSSVNSDGTLTRLNPGADSTTLYRDNNTDNAILSHVMSLISSNAIPTPPLIPVASYSSADYYLPTSDHRFHRSIRG